MSLNNSLLDILRTYGVLALSEDEEALMDLLFLFKILSVNDA